MKLILLTIGVLISCLSGAEPELKIKYSCKVPVGLKKEIRLQQKSGEVKIADAHEIYKEYHAKGWHELLQYYLDEDNVDMDYLHPALWGIYTHSERIGILEAKAIILRLELTSDDVSRKKAVRGALQEYKKIKKQNTKHNQDPASK